MRAAHSAAITAHLLAEARDVARRREPSIPILVSLPCGLTAHYVRGLRHRPEQKSPGRRKHLRSAPSHPTRSGGPGLPIAV